MIKQYESIAAMRAEYIRLYDERGAAPYESYGSSGSWYNNETRKQTLHFTDVGKTDLVPIAEQQMHRLDLAIETPRFTWDRSPAGAFCSVPDVLAGLPTPMRRRVDTPDTHAPIHIYFVTTSSASVDAETLQRRGTTILALTMALSRVRPVNLWQGLHLVCASSTVFNDPDSHWITLFYAASVDEEPVSVEPDKCDGWQWFDMSKPLPPPLFEPLGQAVDKLREELKWPV